jgi:hypothetical protein
MVRRYARVAAVLAGAGLASAGTAALVAQPAAAAGPCTTAQTIQIADLSFHPPAVLPGQTSDAVATLVNCTDQTQSARAQWEGRFVDPSGNFPPGCPVIDPISLPVSLPPLGSQSSTVGYLVPASCEATGLVVTVQVIQNGVVVAQRSADLVID